MSRVEERLPHVVIVGGGFGGLTAARALRGEPVRITLVDRRNHHVFQPLLYQVATAGLSESDIAAPIRHILRRQPNATVLLANVSSVDPVRRTLQLDIGELSYDFLILATGATHSYFGHDEWATAAPGLKTLEDALEIRRRVLLAYEAAERETDPQRRADWLTFVVVGGGPTGVELAGTLAEIARHTLTREFRRIDPATQARVVLLEGADRVLLAYTPRLSQRAKEQLEHLGVQVRTGALVTAVDAAGVSLGEERIPSRTVLWAAGVAASAVGRTLGAPVDRAGRVKVEPELTIPGHRNVFVIGDLATMTGPGGSAVPGVAPAAMQMGRHAVKNILRALQNQPLRKFTYVDKGTLATVGRRAGVAMVAGLQMSGALAWLAWLGIHIFFLIGFRNRFVVITEWLISYFTYQRNARLLFGDPPPPGP
jgi:NADH:ubiquinone reductase (H+-translocating)